MKPLKKILKTAEPYDKDSVSKGDEAFVKKHTVEKTEDANGNDDEHFTASNIKPSERSPRHGYTNDQDNKVYEENKVDARKGKVYHSGEGEDRVFFVHSGEYTKDGRSKGLIFDRGASGRSKKKPVNSSVHTPYLNNPEAGKNNMALTPANQIPDHVKKYLKEDTLSEVKGQYELKPGEKYPEGKVGAETFNKAFRSMKVVFGKKSQKIGDTLTKMSREKELAQAGRKGTPEDVEKIRKKAASMARHLGRLAKSPDPDFASVGQTRSAMARRIANEETQLDEKKLTAKQKKHLDKAPPYGKITKADFDALRNEETEQIDEVLKASDPASKWIRDFVKSKDPRFKSDSKKERIDRALGAWAKARREKGMSLRKEETDYEDND